VRSPSKAIPDQFGPFYYDSEKVSSDKVPSSYADVLDPFWKDKIALTYPNDDDGVLYQFKLIIEQHGFGWLDKLLQQNVRWVRGATAATKAIIDSHDSGSGSIVLSFSGLGGFTPSTSFLKVQKPRLPDRFMTWAQQGAIFASTKRPESAKLLSAFLLSDKWQKPIAARGAPSVRSSLSVDNDVFKAADTDPFGYIDFMNNRTEVEWWRMQMETSIGLAVGPDPVLA
jgi:ABC-type Fe3+ transport system substrate-binding protein